MTKYFFFFTIILLVLGFCFYFSSSTIHIIRHGDKVIAEGIKDAPLTDLGKQQAKAIGIRLAKRPNKPNVLFVSPMKRARETALLIQKEIKSSLVFDHRLTEKSYYQTTETHEDGTFKFSKHKNGIKESPEEHLKRLMSFIQEKTTLFNKEVWVVAHGGLMARIFEKISKRTNTPLPMHLKIDYASEFVFSYNKITRNFSYKEHHYVDHK